jgi:hypothetical protein
MADIFISHANELAGGVLDQVTKVLAEAGHHLDGSLNLQHGEDWETEIRRSLNRAELVVILIDQEAVNSEYLLNEISYVIGFARTTADVEILPILIGDFNAPTELGRLLYLKISSPPTSADFDLVKSRVSSLLGRQAAESKQREEIQVQFRSKAADFISASL